ncbi:SPOR domain-containing protein [Sphingomonas sp. 1P06PA]|uniref:SPOR domain-containing protein n=1 Tax=Sphingomonas sp. 1P06PA TaxID=554121 RepID=UPI0039A5E445
MVDGARTGDDEDRLPWLEPVEDEDGDDGVGTGKLIAAVVMALVALGLVVGGVFWLRDSTAGPATGDGELIAAPEGAYKSRPDDPGGMQVEGQGDIAYAASEGASPDTGIDLSRLPEAPVKDGMTSADAVAPKSAPATAATQPAAPAPAPAPAKAQPAPAAKAPIAVAAAPKAAPKAAAPAPAAASAAGGTIQLGAFSSEAKANAAWKSLAGRYAYLGALSPLVTPVTSGSNTLYRLRVAAGGQAGAICGRLKVAGETCATIN